MDLYEIWTWYVSISMLLWFPVYLALLVPEYWREIVQEKCTGYEIMGPGVIRVWGFEEWALELILILGSFILPWLWPMIIVMVLLFGYEKLKTLALIILLLSVPDDEPYDKINEWTRTPR